MQTVFAKKKRFKYRPLGKCTKSEVVCANKYLHPIKQITTKLCLTRVFKVLFPLAVNPGRIAKADAERNSFYLRLLHHESKLAKGLQDLQNVAGDLDAQIQQCNIEHFPWACALKCHKAGMNQSFLIHKSFSLKYSFLFEQHRLLRSRSFTHSRCFLLNH